jgi:hypothetical protein
MHKLSDILPQEAQVLVVICKQVYNTQSMLSLRGRQSWPGEGH